MSFHHFHIEEIYTNSSGTVQFIEFLGETNNQHLWAGRELISNSGMTFDDFTNLPSSSTSGKSVLVATQGFADLGLVTPDFIVPNNFLLINMGSIDFPVMDSQHWASLPSSGVVSISGLGATNITSTPRNFDGDSAKIPGNPIVGTSGANTLTGTAGSDFMVGLAGNDTLNGGSGTDILNGGSGKDTLNGGAGNDTLKGLDGADVLKGGDGADRFDFDAPGESGPGTAVRDEIGGFKRGQGDRIDLSTIDANGGGGGNGTFQFAGNVAAFSGNATGKLRFDAASDVLFGSTDADKTAEFSIYLPGVSSMGVQDFVL